MTMPAKPQLPPLYRLYETQPDADMRALGRRQAEGGGDAGSVFWSPRADRFQAAMVIAPEEPLHIAVLSVYLGMLAMGDALGSLIPPGVDVTFVWPNRIHLNGARLGTVDIDVPSGITRETTPEWLTLTFDLAITAQGGEATAESIDVTITTLEDEGCGDIDSAEMLETLARHAMTWSNRWFENGFAAMRKPWVIRVDGDSEPVILKNFTGRFIDLDESGDLLVDRDGASETIGLIEALGLG